MAKQLVKNAADREQVKKAQKKETDGRRSELNDLKRTLEMPHGRRALYRILAKTGFPVNPYCRDSRDTAFNCGKFSAGEEIAADLKEANKELYSMMFVEQFNPEDD